MGRYGDPVTWLEAGDEQLDAEPEDALDVVGDAEPVGQLPQIEYENIPDAEQAPDVHVDGVIFEFHDDWPWDTFAEGQSTTYLVNRPDEPLQTYTLRNWDPSSGSWALWYQYVSAYEILFGESERNQFVLQYLNNYGDIDAFGYYLKDEFDRKFERCG